MKIRIHDMKPGQVGWRDGNVFIPFMEYGVLMVRKVFPDGTNSHRPVSYYIETYEVTLLDDVSAAEERIAELERENASKQEIIDELHQVCRRVAAATTDISHAIDYKHAAAMMQARASEPFVHLDDLVSDRVADLECQVAQLESELATLRQQANSGLGEEIRTQEEWDALPSKQWIMWGRRDREDWSVGTKKRCFGPRDYPDLRYFRWTPPTLPPEPEVSSVPKWRGCLKCTETGELLFVTGIATHTVTGVASNGVAYYSTPTKFYELYDHPDCPNTPELIAALKGGE